MKLFPRRALVALGLAVAAVAMAAAPAGADTLSWGSGSLSGGNGAAQVNSYYGASPGLAMTEEPWSIKPQTSDNTDQFTCTEVWVDWFLGHHRPSDVFTNCNTAHSYYGGRLALDWPPSTAGNYDVPVNLSDEGPYSAKIEVCKLDVRRQFGNFARDDGANCTHYGTEPGSILNHSYENLSLGGIESVYGCGTSTCWPGGADLEPQYRNHGAIDILGLDYMDPGSVLVAWDGNHFVSLQHDGNLVVWNQYGQVTWSMNNCLVAGEHLDAGSHLDMQSDGNLVMYNHDWSHAIWASANRTTCGAGSSGGSGQYLKMQSDGNLVVYSSAGPLWSTGTNGR